MHDSFSLFFFVCIGRLKEFFSWKGVLVLVTAENPFFYNNGGETKNTSSMLPFSPAFLCIFLVTSRWIMEEKIILSYSWFHWKTKKLGNQLMRQDIFLTPSWFFPFNGQSSFFLIQMPLKWKEYRNVSPGTFFIEEIIPGTFLAVLSLPLSISPQYLLFFWS